MADPKTSFKQYIAESKKQLEAAMGTVPVQTQDYDINSYCRLMVGETIDEKVTVNLKPGHMISILWEYSKADDPDPINIRFINVENLDSEAEFDLYWSKSQLTKWLCNNTKK